ncbi:MAG: hypothetical protein CGU28_00825 [Candidatus Dactylopiibacterium carminicum]|uniref:Porin n=1 Tax=Candidatus Dactylopiibacterium carminicum TaxID=857335 RepID=A0A272EVZ3_9RHOO|nr:porin [Candidatus Dactylopiibacterium carminicum]KAF7597666.1 porin [Candidatus Dactylopiibacterium carminicum]PAS93544.1 MAG: hypothetical protein BSR46_17620 [Candidatus Dactylopiibacterium carminicum]PAS94226.1 MAG: hypothetical protein CGU29_04165 [Candidatus Dactylopiibacterium carminicum]PAS98423.1 MAG: hypothetical protein CGU28_00825 [Candidatus Dactylopiibacterium carminicum]
MQKKIIALAVAGMMSGAAFAQVTIGGKVDAGYQFKTTQAGENNPGQTTQTLSDGGASTSRITFGAKEKVNDDLEPGVSMDLRFGDFFAGKGGSTANAQSGGLNSNDKKAVYLQSKTFGRLQWGVQNIADDYYVAKKPYMVDPKDLEIVKYGIATYRTTLLTSRTTQYLTPTLSLGQFKLGGEGYYAFGDNSVSGANDADGVSSGDVVAGGLQFAYGKWVNGGFARTSRYSQGTAAANQNGFNHAKTFVNVYPIENLKLSATYINQSGRVAGAAWQDKITNYVISYNFNGKAAIGAEYSVVRDVGESRNSGSGWMVGGAYFLTKTLYFYAAAQKNDWERRESVGAGGGYNGTATSFSSNPTKADMKYYRVGLVKEF